MVTTNTGGTALSAEYTTHTAQHSRWPVSRVEFRWDGSNWTDETANIAGHSGETMIRNRAADLSEGGGIGTATITLHNTSYRYSAYHSGGDSTIRSYLSGANGWMGIGVRISVGFELTSTAKTITKFENSSGNLKITATSHGYVTGDFVRLRGTILYDGQYTVLSYTSNTFTVSATFDTNTATGTAYKCEYVYTFTGVVYSWREDSAAKTIAVEARDWTFQALQKRHSTIVYSSQTISDWVAVLAAAEATLTANVTGSTLFKIPYCWLDDESIVDEIYRVAATEGCFVWTEYDGDLRVEHPSVWTTKSSVWTFDADDLVNIQPQVNPDELATTAVVEYAPRVTEYSQVLYTHDRAETIAPNTTLTVDVRLQRPALAIYDLKPEEDYWLMSPAGVNMNRQVSVTMTKYAQRATVQFQYTPSPPAIFPIVVAFLQLRGLPLTGAPSREVEQNVDTPAISFDRVRSVRGNPYLQTEGQAKYLATYLADRLAQIVPTWPLAGVPGVPQLELGDRVTWSDSRIMSSARTGFVTAIRWRFSPADGYQQDIDILDDASLWPAGTYFTIGSTALGSGVCWY